MQVLVQPGARVGKGEPLMIIEAMKMEHTITAPAHGVVAQALFARGDQVKEGEQLFQFEPDPAPAPASEAPSPLAGRPSRGAAVAAETNLQVMSESAGRVRGKS